MKAITNKKKVLASVAFPCLYGWCAEVLFVFILGWLEQFNLNAAAIAAPFVYFPVCAVIMGVIHSLCLPSSEFELEKRDHMGWVCIGMFHGIHLALVLGAIACLCGTTQEFIKALLSLIGTGFLIVILVISTVIILFALFFDLGRNVGQKYTLPTFFGLNDQWEKEQ